MNESISMIGRNVMMMCGALIAIIKPTIPFIIICTCGVHGLYHRVVVFSKSEKDVSRKEQRQVQVT